MPRDNKKKDDKKEKKKTNDKIGYIPAQLCEWVSARYVEENTDFSIIDAVMKSKFIKQITEMHDRAEKYSRQIDEYTLNLTFFPPKFKKLESDTNDMTSYLNNIFEQKESTCTNQQTVLKQLEQQFEETKQRHTQELQVAREAFESMQKELLPVNLKLKEALNDNSSLETMHSNLEANRAEFQKELQTNALQHQAHIYEMEKENVRQLFEIREQIPKWVKIVSNENMNMETGRMHCILNNYRLELGDLLKRYVGKPNQMARRAIEENEQLTKTLETNALNIKLIVGNTEAMMRSGDVDVHEMHDLASNVKENKVLLKSFATSQDLAPSIISDLKQKVLESQHLVKRLNESYLLSKQEREKIISQIEKLDHGNFRLQSVIRSFQGVFERLMGQERANEPLLNNLKVAACLDISTEQNSQQRGTTKLEHPYNIFQTTPIFQPTFD